MSEPATRSSRPRLLLSVASVWGVQVLGMVLQLGYAAFTARVFTAEAFGAYAVAMATQAMAAIFAVSGFAKASARRVGTEDAADRSLASAAVLVGLVLALVLVATAGFIAALWKSPESAPMIRLLALSLPVAAYAGVLLGVLRRKGWVAAYNRITLVASVLGVGAGALAVWSTRAALSMVVMPITVQVGTVLGGFALLGRSALPAAQWGLVAADVRFSVRSSGNSALTYAASTVPLIVLGRAAGTTTLGYWNRATTVTQVPVESATSAWTTVFFSRLRGERSSSHARQAQWTDMLTVSALVILPLCGALLGCVPAGVRILLGPGWTVAGQMAAWLWVASCVTAVGMVLFTALEATDNFSVLWFVQGWRVLVLMAASVALALTLDWRWLAAGVLVSAVGSLIVALRLSAGRGLVDNGRCVSALCVAAGVGLVLFPVPAVLARTAPSWVVVGAGVLIGFAYLGLLYAVRARIPAMLILSR